jgi:hypothetical protein
MELSHYLGQLMSIVLVLIGLALVLRGVYYTDAYKVWMKNKGLKLFTSMVVLVAGVALVIAHNVWIAGWEVLITIVGWGMILKGVLLGYFPKEFDKMIDWLLEIRWLVAFGGAVWVIGGLYLGYFVWFV